MLLLVNCTLLLSLCELSVCSWVKGIVLCAPFLVLQSCADPGSFVRGGPT